MSNYAIIVAGGKGKRMKSSTNKCFLRLHNKEIIVWTIEAFSACSEIDGIVCVLGDANEIEELKKLLNTYKLTEKVQELVPTGGIERQDGVWTGVQQLKTLSVKPDDIVLIHNGANPLVKRDEIISSIDSAKKNGASVCAMPIKDTVKRVGNDLLVIETLNRKELWAMQTPQAIKYSLAIEAFQKAFQEGFYGTDDAQLVERLGRKVKIVECSYENFKITTSEDLVTAEQILARKKNSMSF